jgi:non-homologous end joining protein Ku
MIAGLKRHPMTGESCPGSARIEHRGASRPEGNRADTEAAPVIDLMSALKRSLAQETPAKGARAKKEEEADHNNT